MQKAYDLFKVKEFLDILMQCHDEKATETQLGAIEQQLKTCLGAEQIIREELYENKREIAEIEDELKKIETWHNELLEHPALSNEKKQQLHARIEHTKTTLHRIKEHL